MNEIVKKYAGPFAKLIPSHTSSSRSSSVAATGVTYEPTERLIRTGASVWAWAATRVAKGRDGLRGRHCLPRRVVDAVGSVPYPTRLADGTSVLTGTSDLPLCL